MNHISSTHNNNDAPALARTASPLQTLIIHQGALGDFLLALPVLEGLVRLEPAMQMDFCARTELVALIAGRSWVGQVHPADSAALAPFFHEDLWPHAAIPRFIETAGQVFVLGQRGSRLLAERLAARLPQPVHWIQSFPGPGQVQPVSAFILEQFRTAGWDLALTPPRLSLEDSDLAAVRQWLDSRCGNAGLRPVLLHPGSGGRGKIWPLARWWGLMEWLGGCSRQPVCLSLGPADEHLRDFAREAHNRLGVHLLEPLELPRLAAFLSRCLFYVGNDSGVSHLAAAVGVPTVAIFGPTDSRVWGPVGDHVRIVQSHWQKEESLAWSRDEVPSCLEAALQKVLEELLTAG